MDNAPEHEGLREDSRMVIDYPGRKLMVYPNPSGEVVLMIEEGGERSFTCIEPGEIDALCVALRRAGAEAKSIADALSAEYGAYEVIEKAKGN